VNETLKESIEPSIALKDGFWPSIQVALTEEDELNDNNEVFEEFA